MANEIVPLAANAVTEERLKSYIEVWKKTIEVQEHFNDLELRIRNFAITVLGAVLSGTALSFKEGLTVLAALLVFVALVTWLAFYFMDRFWYHRLLYGAVKQGVKIEKRLVNVLPEIDLTNTIGLESPLHITINGKEREINTTRKMDLFYGVVAFLLAVLMVALFAMRPSEKSPEPGVTINNIMPGAATPTPSPQDNSNSAAGGRNAHDAAPTNAKTGH
jgi:hypothetical protein